MPKKYESYYNQVLSAKEFPFDLKAIHPAKISLSLQSWIRRKKLPYEVTRTLSRITVNKKADA